jgi:hypothetical protein
MGGEPAGIELFEGEKAHRRFEAEEEADHQDPRAGAGEGGHQGDQHVERRGEAAAQPSVITHQRGLQGHRQKRAELHVEHRGCIAGDAHLPPQTGRKEQRPHRDRHELGGAHLARRPAIDDVGSERTRDENAMAAPEQCAHQERRTDEGFHPRMSE